MKPEELYHELRNLADRLGVHVLEHNFRPTGIKVRSGYCKVKNRDHCIIDKHLKVLKKSEVLAECLIAFPLEAIFILPAVREYLDTFTLKKSLQRDGAAGKGAVGNTLD